MNVKDELNIVTVFSGRCGVRHVGGQPTMGGDEAAQVARIPGSKQWTDWWTLLGMRQVARLPHLRSLVGFFCCFSIYLSLFSDV